MSTIREAEIADLAATIAAVVPQQHLHSAELLHDLAARWSEQHRVWHGPKHLQTLLAEIASTCTGEAREVLLLAALYHDAIYDPRAADNEAQSAELFQQHARAPQSALAQSVVRVILDSAWQQPPEFPLSHQFFYWDTYQLSDACPLHARLEYERAIFREYQWAPWSTYRSKRAEFLETWRQRFPEQSRGTAECRELLHGLAPRIAVYPGSFHPFHLGHLSILRQAEAAFDKVVVAVGVNRSKPGAKEAAPARFAQLSEQLRFHEVVLFDGLLTEFVESLGYPVTLVRGVRDGTDLEAELRLQRFLEDLRPSTRVLWIGCDASLQHISSSGVRELESIQPGAGARYVPTRQQVYGLRV